MKIMNKCDSVTENELKIFWKINHENIVKYFDHFHVRIGVDHKTGLLTEFGEVSSIYSKTSISDSVTIISFSI